MRNHSLVEGAVLLRGDGEPFGGTLPIEEGTVDYDAAPELLLEGRMAQNGSPLTAWAFERGLGFLGGRGRYIITLAVFLFGVSTAISWSYYGDRSITYLAGPSWVKPYKTLYLAMHFLGAIFPLEIVWGFGDVALGLMALPNLIAILLLLPTVRALSKEYFSRKQVPYRK